LDWENSEKSLETNILSALKMGLYISFSTA